MTFHRSIWVFSTLLYTLFSFLMPCCLQYETIAVSHGSMQSNYYWTDTISSHNALHSYRIWFHSWCFMSYGKHFIYYKWGYFHFSVLCKSGRCLSKKRFFFFSNLSANTAYRLWLIDCKRSMHCIHVVCKQFFLPRYRTF